MNNWFEMSIAPKAVITTIPNYISEFYNRSKKIPSTIVPKNISIQSKIMASFIILDQIQKSLKKAIAI